MPLDLSTFKPVSGNQGATPAPKMGKLNLSSFRPGPAPAKPSGTSPFESSSLKIPGLTDKGTNLVKKAASAFSLPQAGQDIAQGFYLAFGGQNKIDSITKEYLDNASTLTKLAAKQKDPAMRDKYRNMAIGMVQDAQKSSKGIIGDTRTPEQIVGDMMGVAADVVGAGSLETGAAKEAAPQVAKTLGQRVLQKSGEGAIRGGIFGTVQGAAKSMQDRGSAKDVVRSSVEGGAIGAGGGAALGALSEAVPAGVRKIAGQVSPQEEKQAITDMIQPKATAKEAKLATMEGRLVKGENTQRWFRWSKVDQVLPTEEQSTAADIIQKQIPAADRQTEPELYTALDNKIKQTATELQPEMKKVKIRLATVKKMNTDLVKLQKAQLKGPQAGTRDEVDSIKAMQKDFAERIKQFMKGGTMNDIWNEAKAYDRSVPATVRNANELSSDATLAKQRVWLQNRAVLRDTLTEYKGNLGKQSEQAFNDMHSMYDAQQSLLSKAKIETKPIAPKINVKKMAGRIGKAAIKGAATVAGGGVVYEAGKKSGLLP